MRTIKNSAHFLCLMALCCTLGCSTVSSLHPIGTPIAEDLSADFSGAWMGAEGHQLQLHCNPKGQLSFATLEWKNDAGEFRIESGSGFLTSSGDLLFFNFIDEPGEERPTYTFVLLRLMDQQLVIWLPDFDEFRSLVEEKFLAGEILEGDQSREIILTGNSEEIAKTLQEQDLARLFDWSKPALVLVRATHDFS